MDHVGPVFCEQFADRRPGDDVRKIEDAQPLQGPPRGGLERDRFAIAEADEFDRRYASECLALRVGTPFLRAAQDRGAQAPAGKFVLQRLGVMARHPPGDRRMLARAVQELQNTLAQVGVGTVEEDLAAVAGLVERVHGRVDGADVELPAALEEIGDLVEKQAGMAAINRHALAAEAAAWYEASQADEGTVESPGHLTRLQPMVGRP